MNSALEEGPRHKYGAFLGVSGLPEEESTAFKIR